MAANIPKRCFLCRGSTDLGPCIWIPESQDMKPVFVGETLQRGCVENGSSLTVTPFDKCVNPIEFVPKPKLRG